MDQARVLVIKLSSLGDLFHALPTVHAIRRSMDCIVDWVTQPAYLELAARFDDVQRVLSFPRRGFRRGVGAYTREVRSVPYDLAVDLQGLMKSAVALRLVFT